MNSLYSNDLSGPMWSAPIWMGGGERNVVNIVLRNWDWW